MANEAWRAENDPAERNRIQNRLARRAFRERRKAGVPTRRYTRQSIPSATQQQVLDDEPGSPQFGPSSINHAIRSSEIQELKEWQDLLMPMDLQAMASSRLKRGRGRSRKRVQPNLVEQPAVCEGRTNSTTSTPTLTDMFALKGLSPKRSWNFGSKVLGDPIAFNNILA